MDNVSACDAISSSFRTNSTSVSCDVMPRCSRLDRAGIENRLVDILSCGVGQGVIVLSFHDVVLTNGHGCRVKFERPNQNRDRLFPYCFHCWLAGVRSHAMQVSPARPMQSASATKVLPIPGSACNT